MKRNHYLTKTRAVNGKKWQTLIALTLLMLGFTILFLLIEHANAPADMIVGPGLWL